MIRIIYLALFGIAITACVNPTGIFGTLNKAEREYKENLKKTHVVYMDLESMFPDPKVRALAKAAGKGKIKKVETLVSDGVDINARGTSNATPLFWSMRNINGYKKLLELGADPNVKYHDGSSVMKWAASHKDERFLKLALKYGGDPNVSSGGSFGGGIVFDSIMPEKRKKLYMLLDAGVDINSQRDNGRTLMDVAAGLGQFDLVYELLERGADYRIKDKNGKDLVHTINTFKNTFDPKSELTKWMFKVIEWINKKEGKIVIVPNLE